ncbi:sigma factor-binding protein Crl [Vibrio sp. AK197]|uniref:Sigma factor-binding protein Crl n=1 Tax=Vibrio olivae TaxID=1243002 RepID=A0ABV5HGN4_9VIBR
MSEVTKLPTHYRLLSTLRAVGPYLREVQCRDGFYLFDCLSVCVDEKKSPEEREFWGWWLELEQNQHHCVAKYHIGLYNDVGDWVPCEISAAALKEVKRTQEAFHTKLTDTLSDKFEMTVELHSDSCEFV